MSRLERWDRRSWVVVWGILGICWATVGAMRGTDLLPFALHGWLTLLFVVAGLALLGLDLWLHCDLSTVRLQPVLRQIGLAAPQGRIGYRIVLVYLLLTFAAFVWTHPMNWNFRIREVLAAQASDPHVVLLATLVPFYEEFFFRGTLQSVMAGRLAIGRPARQAEWWALYLAALVFWLFHVPLDLDVWRTALASGGVPLSPGPLLIGLACGFVTAADRSILMAVVLHGAANFLGDVWGQVLPGALQPMFFSPSCLVGLWN